MLNVKFLIFNCFCVVFLFGYEANSITGAELEQLKVIDKKIYDLSIQDIDYDYLEIIEFIFKNISYDIKYSKLKITATARSGINSNDTIRDDGTISTNRQNNFIGINLTYPIFDKKESNQRAKEIINIKNLITKDVQDYFKSKLELLELETENKILIQLEIRNKARKLDGVGGFDDWLKTINEIKQNRFKIGYKKLEVIKLKQKLLNYVKPNLMDELKGML